jgi:hypothetical protein
MPRGSMSPSPPSRVRPLHLPTPGISSQSRATPRRSRAKGRKRPSKLKHLGMGVLCIVGGSSILAALMALADQFNTLLLVSQAVANLIRGLSLLATGLLQMLALLTVATLTLLALLLLVGGLTRMVRAFGGALAPSRSESGGSPVQPPRLRN